MQQGEPLYHPNTAQYEKMRVIACGTKVNHLPAVLFRELADMLVKYQHSARLVQYPEGLVFDSERGEYIRSRNGQEVRWQRDGCLLCISTFPDEEKSGVHYLSIEMQPLSEETGVRRIPPEEVFAGAPSEDALILSMSGAMKSRWYYPARRFLQANHGKYILPGYLPHKEEVNRIAVIDTEMERPYPIQFAGVLLEKRDGIWAKTKDVSTYIALPKGRRLTRDVKRVTGLDDEILRQNGLPEREALTQIADFLKGATFICGHAVLADIEIMRGAYIRQEMELPYALKRHELIDTQMILSYIFHLENMTKLERAAEMAGVQRQGDTYHDARTDADVTARLFMKLEPEFVQSYGTLPVVNDAMMHAPQELSLLGRILGKRPGPERAAGAKRR